jgi:hypothetical protein
VVVVEVEVEVGAQEAGAGGGVTSPPGGGIMQSQSVPTAPQLKVYMRSED